MKQAVTRREEGVALITVLVIVAAMSSAAIALSSAVLATTSRARALDASVQADWYALAAEEYGRAATADLVAATQRKLFAGMPGLGQPMQFDVEGGRITVTGHDASNCFNLNTLRASASTEQDGGSGATPREDFTDLLTLARIEGVDAQPLLASLVDWMDTDQSPGMGGAEDGYYGSLGSAYRTSGQPLAGLSELRAIRYYSAGMVATLDPFICAYPTAVQQPFNINTLTGQQAPLLSLAFSGALNVEQARDVIFQRPGGGWKSVSDFLAEPAIAEIAPDLLREDMLSVEASYIGVDASIEYRGTHRRIDILLVLEEAGLARTVRRERKG